MDRASLSVGEAKVETETIDYACRRCYFCWQHMGSIPIASTTKQACLHIVHFTMKEVTLVCINCNTSFQRATNEHKRNTKLGRRVYCSRSCSAKHNPQNLGKHYSSGDMSAIKKWISLHGPSRCDEFTPFRFHLRQAKARHKKQKTSGRWDYDENLALVFLKDLWEKQEGKCAISGVQLVEHCAQTSRNGPNTASLDRIDNSKGYIQGNVRFVSYIANICRGRFSDKDVAEFCQAVIQKSA